jgi:hypothetical protein
MKSLDPIYLRILTTGLVNVIAAAEDGDTERCRVEAEHIHNIPSLIGEDNINRHLCYANTERKSYADWIYSNVKKEYRGEIMPFYYCAWREMDTILGIKNFIYEMFD